MHPRSEPKEKTFSTQQESGSMEKSLFSQVVFNKDLFGIIKKHLDIPPYINMNGAPTLWDEQYKKSLGYTVVTLLYKDHIPAYAKVEYVYVAYKTRSRRIRVKRVYMGANGGYMLQTLAINHHRTNAMFYSWVQYKDPFYRCNACSTIGTKCRHERRFI